MSKRVYKYQMPAPGAVTTLELPDGAQPVHLDWQHGEITMWATVDPNRPLVRRTFLTVGTGHPVADDAVYVGTVYQSVFVWHVFMVGGK